MKKILFLCMMVCLSSNGAGLVNGTLSPSGSVFPSSSSTTVNSAGSDSNNGTQLLSALARANAGSTVILNPGVYDVGTNVINIPHNVSLVGGGSGSTFILSSCAFNTAPGGTYFNNCDIVPGDNSSISGFTLGCTTNGKYAAGIGSIYRTAPSKACTNVTVRNVVFTNFSSDVFYVEQTARCSWDVYDSKLGIPEGPAHFDVIAHVTATANSRFRYFDCSAYVDPNGVTAINPTAIGNAINHLQGQCDLYNYACTVTNALNAGGFFSQGLDFILNVYGANINLYLTNSGIIQNYAGPSSVGGYFTINGQTFQSGNGSSSAQARFVNSGDGSVVSYGPSVDRWGDFIVTPMDSVNHFSFSSFSLLVNTNTGVYTMHHTGPAIIDGLLTAADGSGISNVNVNGAHTNQYTISNFVIGSGANQGTGSGVTFSTNNATDKGFGVVVTTGNAAQTGNGTPIVTVTFSSTFSQPPNFSISPANATAAALANKSPYVVTTTTNLVVTVGTSALTLSTTNAWSLTLQGKN